MENFAAQQVMTGSHGQVWLDGSLGVASYRS